MSTHPTARSSDGFPCPRCGQAMESGWLALYEPTLLTRLVWQNEQAGWVRLRMPEESTVVIKPQPGGGGSPTGYICKDCDVVTFRFDRAQTT